jgi:hypothetical protein
MKVREGDQLTLVSEAITTTGNMETQSSQSTISQLVTITVLNSKSLLICLCFCFLRYITTNQTANWDMI